MAKHAAKQADLGPAKKKARTARETGKHSRNEPKFRVKGSPRPALKSSKINVEAEEPPRKDKGKGKAADLKDDEDTMTPTSKPLQPKLRIKSKTKPVEADAAPTPLPTTFKIIAGSYEKLLYGLEGTVSLDETATTSSSTPYTFNIKPMFIFPAHVSCIKAVAASPQGGKWLATGSSDEIIKVWDLRRRKEIGGLMHHEGSITSLTFPSRSHLLSTSEDGTLCLFHARDWSVLRTLKGHKGRVNSVAVHPSGKVALSVGRDRMLRMWDLMRGRGVASTKLVKEGEVVRWSTTGDMFVVQSGSSLDIYTTHMKILHSITHPSRIHDMLFFKPSATTTNSEDLQDEVLFVTAEDKRVSIYSIPQITNEGEDDKPKPRIFAALVGHSNRVKAVQTLSIALPKDVSSDAATQASTTVITTISSDGKIHVYDSHSIPSPPETVDAALHEISPVAVYDTEGTRLTCLTLADGEIDMPDSTGASEKRKRRDDDEEQEEAGKDDEREENEEEETGDEEEWGGVEVDEEEEEEGEEAD